MTSFGAARRLYDDAMPAVITALGRQYATGSDRRHTTMVPQMFSYLRRVRVTVAYTVMLVVIALTQLALGPRVHNAVVSHMSTNLHNLSRGHLGTLVGSAFVTDAGGIYVVLPGLVCLLALGELVWRSGHLVLAFALGHIGATLIVAAGLAVAIEAGWLPTSIAHASDVGVSYGAAGVLGALMAVIPRRWQPAWAGWWLAVTLVGASVADFTAVGHTVALLLGMALSSRLGSAARWTPARVVMLVAAVAFGYLMITGSSPVTAAVAAPAGLLVALIAQGVARRLPKLRSFIAQSARIASATEMLRLTSLDLADPAVGAITGLRPCAKCA
jgi:hypothetical protein